MILKNYVFFDIGIFVHDKIIKFKVLGITGDAPALKIILNFIVQATF